MDRNEDELLFSSGFRFISPPPPSSPKLVVFLLADTAEAAIPLLDLSHNEGNSEWGHLFTSSSSKQHGTSDGLSVLPRAYIAGLITTEPRSGCGGGARVRISAI